MINVVKITRILCVINIKKIATFEFCRQLKILESNTATISFSFVELTDQNFFLVLKREPYADFWAIRNSADGDQGMFKT